MSYDEDGLIDEEQSFKVSDDDSDLDDLDESLEPLEGVTDPEFDDEDPDSRYH